MSIFNLIPRMTIMHFESSPKLEGKFYVAEGVLTIVVTMILVMIGESISHSNGLLGLFIPPFFALLYGLYMLFFSRKNVKHEIYIGSWGDSVYRFSRPLFIVFEIVCTAAECAAVLGIVCLLDWLTDADKAEFAADALLLVSMFAPFVIIQHSMHAYLKRYAYYLAPDKAHVYNPMNEKFSWRNLWKEDTYD